MDVKPAITRLREKAFLDEVRSALATWGDDVRPADVDATIEWIDARRTDLADLLELVGDGDDARMICAIRLVEYKAHWITINTRVNYTAMSGATVPPALAFRGAALSALLEDLEQYLPERAVEAYHAFLAEPLSDRPERVLDEVWDRARNAKPIFPSARQRRGVGSTSSRKSQRRRAA
jgi:hypothetical protein